jgi:hypothetical protein
VFPREFSRRRLVSTRVEPSMEEFGRFGTDGGAQAVALATGSDHRPVDRDVIRATRVGRS